MLNINAQFNVPNFQAAPFSAAANVQTACCTQAGVAPDNFYLTTHFPTFYKVNGNWQLPEHNSLNCVAVLQGKKIVIQELRDLRVGMQVVIAAAVFMSPSKLSELPF